MASNSTKVVYIEGPSGFRSPIACKLCRQRKVKCSREVPYCVICQRGAQQCQYPDTVKRPGPRIGSVKTRKRAQDLVEENDLKNQRKKLSQSSNHDVQDAVDCEGASVVDQSESMSSPASQKTQSLSLIIHPWHESYVPEQRLSPHSAATCSSMNQRDNIASACTFLGIKIDCSNVLLSQFFRSYTSFQLFRESQLREDLQTMEPIAHVNALLSLIAAFSFKSLDSHDSCIQMLDIDDAVLGEDIPGRFANLGIRYLEQAIDECDSNAVPLPLLQALVLCSHWLLARKVCGRSWRYLGLAIRCAYESNLHLIDSERTAEESLSDPLQWQRDEEQRRLWWALWEMDVFASVMRRCPTAMDWSQNETFLPSEDENWYNCRPQKSCFLAASVVDRSKELKASGNQSPKAWFIVINSMVKDAQNVSSRIGVWRNSQICNRTTSNNRGTSLEARREKRLQDTKAASARLSAIVHSLDSAVTALPPQVKYHDQFLSFGGRLTDKSAAAAKKLEHASLYSIHMMVQLVRLMIFKYHIFHLDAPQCTHIAAGRQTADDLPLGHNTSRSELSRSLAKMAESPFLGQYFKYADEIVTVVSRSSETHYMSVNPFLSNTVWLAAVVQLVHREVATTDLEKDRLHSNFECLVRKYNQFATFWDTSTSLKQDLERFKNELEAEQSHQTEKGENILTTHLNHQDTNTSFGHFGPEGSGQQMISPLKHTSLNTLGTGSNVNLYQSITTNPLILEDNQDGEQRTATFPQATSMPESSHMPPPNQSTKTQQQLPIALEDYMNDFTTHDDEHNMSSEWVYSNFLDEILSTPYMS